MIKPCTINISLTYLNVSSLIITKRELSYKGYTQDFARIFEYELCVISIRTHSNPSLVKMIRVMVCSYLFPLTFHILR